MTIERRLLAAFACSGFAALVYEVVWTRLLTLHLGHTTAAVSTVTAAFMGGLGLGSVFGGHVEIQWVKDGEGPAAGSGQPAVAEPQPQYVARHDLAVTFGKAWLADEQDVEQYLAALKQALLQAIHNGKRVHL